VFVTCGNCDAEYELDDAKIPAGGARLRCTNCSHSFVVTPPEASDIRSADDLAHDALAAGRRVDPDPEPESEPIKSFDFSGEAEVDAEFEAALEAASERGFESTGETEPDPAFEAASEREFEATGETEPDPAFEAAMNEGFDIDAQSADDSEAEVAPEGELDLDGEVESDPESDDASEEGLNLDVEVDPEPEYDAAFEEGLDLDVEDDSDSDFEAASEEGFELNGDADPEAEVEAAPEADFDADGEDDWQFNEDVGKSESDADAPEPALAAAESPFDEGEDWSGLSTAEEAVDDLLGSGDVIEADAAAAVDDLLGGVGGVESPSEESGGVAASESERPSAGLDLGGAPAIDAPDGDLAADAGDAFDDLSDWEMFDQPAGGEQSAGSARAGSADASRGGARAEPRVGIAVEMAGDSRTAVRLMDRVAAVMGWGVVCLLLAFALVGDVTSGSSEAGPTTGSWSGAGFEADQIVGRWVDNATAGSIYVISGRVRRASGSDRAARKSLGIALIDTKGRAIDRAPIPLAPVVPERILREASSDEIDAFQARRAGRIASVGERWIAFEAVVTDLPRFAGRFELQAIER
jgi:predicted Zn finger-like uncharacterized protein